MMPFSSARPVYQRRWATVPVHAHAGSAQSLVDRARSFLQPSKSGGDVGRYPGVGCRSTRITTHTLTGVQDVVLLSRNLLLFGSPFLDTLNFTGCAISTRW